MHAEYLKKLGAIGINLKKRYVILDCHSGYPFVRVDVSLEKVVMDGQEVYCTDISYT